MLEHHPPRREPRLLLVRPLQGSLAWALVDPWEVRGVGRLPAPAHLLLLPRLMLGTHPSAVVLLSSGASARRLAPTLREVVLRRGLPFVEPTLVERRAIREGLLRARDTWSRALPELGALQDAALRRTAETALVALSILSIPSRRYVSRLPPSSPPRLGS